MRRLLAVFLLACLLGVGVAGLAADQYEIAVVPKSLDNPVFFATKAGAEAAAAELGVRLIYTGPVSDEGYEAARVVEDLVNRGVDAIAVSVSNADAMRPILEQADAKGIPIITWDSDCPDSPRLIYYGTPDFELGELVAGLLADALAGQGKVAIFQVYIGHPNLDARYDGMMSKFAEYPGIEVVTRFTTTALEIGLAVDAVENYISAHPEIDGLATTTGFPWWGSVGSMPTVDRRVLDGDLLCVGVDPLESALRYVEAGILEACVGQRFYDMGYHSVNMLYAMLRTPALADYLSENPITMLSSGMDVITKDGGGDSISVEDYFKLLEQWEG
jgi:ribose transport system substrate-binding protein